MYHGSGVARHAGIWSVQKTRVFRLALTIVERIWVLFKCVVSTTCGEKSTRTGLMEMHSLQAYEVACWSMLKVMGIVPFGGTVGEWSRKRLLFRSASNVGKNPP